MDANFKTHVLFCLSGDVKTRWFTPGDVLEYVRKQKKGASREGVNKALKELEKTGIIERKRIPPKKYKPKLRKKPRAGWKKLPDKEKSKISKDSRWQLKPTKVGFREAFEFLWDQEPTTGSYARQFLNSDYVKKNRHILFSVIESHIGKAKSKLLNWKLGYINKTYKDTADLYAEFNQRILEMAAASPTLTHLILSNYEPKDLRRVLLKHFDGNLNLYMVYLANSCMVLDYAKDDSDLDKKMLEENLKFITDTMVKNHFRQEKRNAVAKAEERGKAIPKSSELKVKYVDDPLTVKGSPIEGNGVFTNRDIKKGEIVIKLNTSHKLTAKEVKKLPESERKYVSYNNGEYLLLQSPERYINHSCEPNTTIRDNCYVAIKDIYRGEEITGDYSEDLSLDFEMECKCKSKNCRKIIKNKKEVLKH